MCAATRTINYGRVLEVMSLVSNAGFHKVSLVAEAPKGGRRRRQRRSSAEAGGRRLTAMSVMVLERGVPRDIAGRASRCRRAASSLSAALHLGILVLIIVGLPNLFRPPSPEDQPIAVELVTIAPETRATQPNP